MPDAAQPTSVGNRIQGEEFFGDGHRKGDRGIGLDRINVAIGVVLKPCTLDLRKPGRELEIHSQDQLWYNITLDKNIAPCFHLE